MALQNKTYQFRIYPNTEQQHLFAKMFGCSRFVWNYFLNKEKEHFLKNKEKIEEERVKNYLSYYDNAKTLTLLKQEPETKFLKDANSQSLQTILKNLDIAYKRFFKKQGGFPNFKKKVGKQSICIPQNLSIKNGMLDIPKFKTGIKIKQHRVIKGRITTSTITKTPTNKYYVSVSVEENIPYLKKINNAIGLDLGIKSFAFLSNGQEILNPKYLVKHSNQLKKQQRYLSRKRKGSNRRNKQKLKVAKIHERITNLRKDFQHKLSSKLVHENQVICIEDLSIKNMLKNHKLAKAIQDSSWSSFVNLLEYKCKWYGRTLIKVDRFFPSSKTCSDCGHINQNLKLKDREWICKGCGVVHQRDWNAAKNILKQGLNLVDRSFGTNDYEHGGNVKPSANLEISNEVFKVLGLKSLETHRLVL